MFFTEVFVRGMDTSNNFNQALTYMKLFTLCIIITFALYNFNSDNLHPFTMENNGGWNATVTAAALVYYSYLGFDVITTLSDEAKYPVRDVPLAVRDNNVIVTIIYVVVSFSLVSMSRLEQYSPETALAEAFMGVGLFQVTKLLYFCGFVGISAACFSNHIVSPSSPSSD